MARGKQSGPIHSARLFTMLSRRQWLAASSAAAFAAPTLLFAQGKPASWTPEAAKHLAEIAAGPIAQSEQVTLDYSPESLKQVDAMVLRWRAAGSTEETLRKTLIVLGCYVGEVMVRNIEGAKWLVTTEKERPIFGDTPILVEWGGNISNPLGKVFKLMGNGEEDSVVGLYRMAVQLRQKALKG